MGAKIICKMFTIPKRFGCSQSIDFGHEMYSIGQCGQRDRTANRFRKKRLDKVTSNL
jgi:hypothetical protein